jgi:hypothetical protein
VIVILSLLAFGCGETTRTASRGDDRGDAGIDPGAGAGTDAGAGDPLSGVMALFCKTARTCCNAAASPFDEQRMAACLMSDVPERALLAAGTLAVNAAALQRCLANFPESGTCYEQESAFLDCSDLFSGRLPAQ